MTRLGVDLDDGDVGAERERRHHGREVGARPQQRLAVGRSEVGPADGARRRAGDVEPPGARRRARRRRRPPRAGRRPARGRGRPAWPVAVGDRRAADLHRARADGEAAGRAPGRCRRGRPRCRSIGTPVRSDTIIAHVVSWPCPNGVAPLRTRSRRPSSSSTAPNSVPRRAGGDLDVDRDADAERDRVAGRPAARLLGPQLVVAGGGERLARAPRDSRRRRRRCRCRSCTAR